MGDLVLKPLLATPKEAAVILRTSEKTIQRMSRRGELPVIMVGNRPRYSIRALRLWERERSQFASVAAGGAVDA